MITKSSFFKVVFALSFASIVFASCKNEDVTPTASSARVSFLQASTDFDAVHFNSKSKILTPREFTFMDFISYQTVEAVGQRFSFTKKGVTTPVTSLTTNLKPGSNYSIFFIGTTSSPGAILVEDNLTVPTGNLAKVRFANLSADNKEFDVAIDGQSTPLFTKTAYKMVQNFKEIAPVNSVKIVLREAGKTTNIAELGSINIERGRVYTIVAKGVTAGTDKKKLGLGVITNR